MAESASEETVDRKMSAAEVRREARRRKILANPQSRMNKIFGVEGKEKEPGLEDGNLYKVKDQDLTNGRDRKTEDISNNNADSERKSKGMKPRQESESVEGPPPSACSLKPLKPSTNPPAFQAAFSHDDRSFYERKRVTLGACLGVVLRVCVEWGFLNAIVLPWLIFQMLLELFHDYLTPYSPLPSGHLVNLLLFCGFSPGVVKVGGRLADAFSRVLDDSAAMFVTFLLAHYYFVNAHG